MGSGRGKKNEEAALTTANQAYQAYTPDPLEEAKRARTMKFMNQFDSGTDVKDIEAIRPFFNLFNNAKNSQANQMIGKGVVALGKSPNADSQVSDLDKYVQKQREEEAAGMLYNATNQAYSDANNDANYLINVDQARKAGRAGLSANMYSTILNRPKRPPLWERLWGLANQTAQSAGSAMTGYGAIT